MSGQKTAGTEIMTEHPTMAQPGFPVNALDELRVVVLGMIMLTMSALRVVVVSTSASMALGMAVFA